jgi:hypothetical protein
MTMLWTQGIKCSLVFHEKPRFMGPDEVAASCVNGFRKPEI